MVETTLPSEFPMKNNLIDEFDDFVAVLISHQNIRIIEGLFSAVCLVCEDFLIDF